MGLYYRDWEGGALSEYRRMGLYQRIKEGGVLSESTGGWGFIRENT